MDDQEKKDFEAMIEGKKDEDNSEFIETEAKPLENLDDISELVDDAPIVDSKDAKDTVDDDVNKDTVNEGDPPTEDEPTATDEEMVRFATQTYGLDPRFAGRLQKAGLLIEALKNTAARRPEEDNTSPPEEEKDVLDGLNLEDVDEDIAKALTSLSDRLKLGDVKNKELATALTSIQEKESLKSRGEDEAKFDEMMKSSTEHSDLLGEGRTVDLDENSKHFRNREEVWHHILLAKELRNGRHKPPLDPGTEMQRALASVFPERQQELSDKKARDEINGKLKTRARTLTVKPTGATNEEIPDGDEKALQALKERHQELTGA